MTPNDAAILFTVLLAMAGLTAGLLVPVSMARWLASIGVLTAPWMNVRVAPSLTLSDVFLVAAIPYAVMSWRRRVGVRDFLRGPHRWLLAIAGLFVIGSALGAVVAEDATGAPIALRFAASVAVVCLLVWSCVHNDSDWHYFAALFVGGAAVSAAFALARPGEYGLGRSIGLTNHPNHLGLSMLLASALAFPLLVSAKRSQRLTAWGAFPLAFAALIASGSRAALAGLVVWGVASAVLSRRFRLPLIVVGALTASAAALVLPGIVDPGGSAVSRTLAPSAREAESSAERAANYQEAIDQIAASPWFGSGFADPLRFHSVPLQMVVNAGLIGVLALLVAVGLAIRLLRRASIPGASIVVRSSAAGVLGAFTALVVSNQLFDRYLTLGLALLISGASLAPPAIARSLRVQSAPTPSVGVARTTR
jgi:O-antigen ligase